MTLSENDENGDGATQTELVDNWMEYPNPDSNQIEVVTTGESNDSLANEKKIGTKLHADVVRAELRVKFLRNLTNLGVGTNRIEENQVKSRKELVRDTG